MAADATLPVRAAIVTRLRDDAGVGAVVADRIYGRPPQDVVFPYVSLGPVTAEPAGGIAQRGWGQSAQIDVWSRQPDRGVEASQIMAAVSAALEAPLSVAGHHVVVATLELQTLVDDPDGITSHGVQRFRIYTREAA